MKLIKESTSIKTFPLLGDPSVHHPMLPERLFPDFEGPGYLLTPHMLSDLLELTNPSDLELQREHRSRIFGLTSLLRSRERKLLSRTWGSKLTPSQMNAGMFPTVIGSFTSSEKDDLLLKLCRCLTRVAGVTNGSEEVPSLVEYIGAHGRQGEYLSIVLCWTR